MFVKLLLTTSLIFSLSNAAGIYDGITFTDYEENASLHFVNYYPYADFVNLGITTQDASNIVLSRPHPDLLSVSNLVGIDAPDMQRIREQSHIIDWNVYTDDFGMTLHQTNFLYGLTGLLVGFGFYFGFIYLIARR